MSVNTNRSDYAAAIRAAVNTRWLGQSFHYFNSVTSTNDVLATLAQNGAPAGTMVITDYQSQGKGRLGRRWLAPQGTSLLFSLLFRPLWPPEKAAWLTMIAGLAVVKAVETLYELTPRLKWPNDLLLPSRDQWLKFGGMLLEAQMTEERLDASILGIGINVNVRPGQLPRSSYPATSLLQESGQQMERPVLLNEVLAALEGGYEAARLGYPPLKAWQDKLVTLGQAVSIVQVGRRLPLTGIAVDTDNMGRLIVREESGREHVVAAGDVTFQVDNSGE